MAYTTILFDIDDTLIDFKGTEYAALKQALEINGLILTEESFEVYKLINHELWQNYEKGAYKKSEILSLRFDLFFVQTRQFGDAAQVSHDFLVAMGDHVKVYDETIPLLSKLKDNYRLAIVTNGAKLAQDLKIAKSGLGTYFEAIFISDVTGYQKPDKRFFEVVDQSMGGLDKKKTLIVGDSLTSDMKGGNNFGIDTCWFNPSGLANDQNVSLTYEIKSLNSLLDIL